MKQEKKSFRMFFNSIHVFICILVYVRTSTSVEIKSHLIEEGEICGGSSFCGCWFMILELPEDFWKVKFYLCSRKFDCAKEENCLNPFALHDILVYLSLNNEVGSSGNIKCVCSDQCNVSNTCCYIPFGLRRWSLYVQVSHCCSVSKMWQMWIIEAKPQFSRMKWRHWASWREKKAFFMSFAR